jgi:MYXO-CTERM domain-containing protein
MRAAPALASSRVAFGVVLSAFVSLAVVSPARAVDPHRSFERLVTGNGFTVASFDASRRRMDSFLEHPYRFFAPRGPAPGFCYSADESRDLAYDVYFGVRSDGPGAVRGEWLPELPLDDAAMEPGTGIIVAEQHAGEGRALRAVTRVFAPMGYDGPALVFALSLTNESDAPVTASPYALLNFHLGDAAGEHEPSEAAEQVAWDEARGVFYEFSDASRGTMAYVPLVSLAAVTVSSGESGVYRALSTGRALDDVRATTGPTDDVVPGMQGEEVTLAPGATAWMAFAAVWALDEDAGPDVDALRGWSAGLDPAALVERERSEWAAWHARGTLPPEFHDDAATMRMAQVREPGAGRGQILASLPPGLGNLDAQWNIAWVRDMAYATAALARGGHLDEARDALRFQLEAPRGEHVDKVGRPYRISITRYFGNGAEESDCNADGPNIEFDGFGLFLWSLGEYVRAGGSVEDVRPYWPVLRDEIADVLVSLVGSDGVILPDSSIWEVHWNGRQRRFTYTSLAAARGLCDAASIATALGETADAARYATAGAGVRDAVVRNHTDARGVLAQSAEDLAAGRGYMDAAAIEALNWGIVDPTGRVASATVRALRENLTVPHGRGLMRNDDGGWYDSQEWVFIDLRLAAATRGTPEAEALLGWIDAQAARNRGNISELHEATTADYRGSVPMVGFGAGARILAGLDFPIEAACGAFAPEPAAPPLVDAGPPRDPIDAGSGVPGRSDAGLDGGVADAGRADASPAGCVGAACGSADDGCGCAVPGARSRSPKAGLVLALLALVGLGARRRTRRRAVRALFPSCVLVLLGALPFVAGCADGTPPNDRGRSDASPDGATPDAATLDADVPDAGLLDAGPGALRCEVELRYRASDSAPRVFVAGTFNGFSTSADALVDDGTGTYRRALLLPPGLYAYKFYVEGDGREPWRLDPDNAYRVYEGGLENSGLRVPDCSRPALRVIRAGATRPAAGAGTLEATLAYDARRAGPLATVRGELRVGAAWRPLSSAELTITADGASVRVTGLADGKYTARVFAADAMGRESESVLVPVWVEPQRFSWDGSLLYMIVADRYRNGDSTNDAPPGDASPGGGWTGGDLQGITDALDDGSITDLGANALWITPFNTNPAGTFVAADDIHRVAGYHGYWPIAPRDVDPRLGGPDALRAMVAAAHARGVRVLMDFVVNHVHEQHPYVAAHPEWFSDGCVCGTPGCDWTERRLDCLFRPYMPDVDWKVPAAQEQFLADGLAWMEEYDLDGFRVDAVKHVDEAAVTNLAVRVRERFETAGTRVFLMGETAMGWDASAGPSEGGNVENYDTISRYIGPNALDGQFDFPLYYAGALQFLRDEPGRGMAHVDYWTRASTWRYPTGAIMTPYLGSHDTPRFLSLQSDPARANNQWSDPPATPTTSEPYDRMYLAFGWLMSLPGAPLLYQGDEYGETGGADPDNRRPLRIGPALTPQERAQRVRVAALGRARAALPGLRSRTSRTLLVTEDLWVVARGEGADLVLVALNRSARAQSVTVPVPRELAAEGRMFADALDPATNAPVRRAALTITLPARGVRYLR